MSIKELTDLAKARADRVKAKRRKQSLAAEDAPLAERRSKAMEEGGADKLAALAAGSDGYSLAPYGLPPEWERVEKEHGRGLLFAYILRASAAAKKRTKDETQEAPIRAIRDLFQDKETAKWLNSRLEKDIAAGVPSDGGYLIAEVLSDQVVQILRQRAIMDRLGSQIVDMPNGNLRIARGVTGAVATYQGENRPIKASSQKVGDMKLAAKKLTTLIPVSNDMLLSRSMSTNAFVRDDAARAMAARKEKARWMGANEEYEPRGLANYTELTSINMNAAITADSIINFLVGLISANVELDDMTSMGWAFGPQIFRDLLNLKATTNEYLVRKEMMEQKTLLGYPYGYTQWLRPEGSGTQNAVMFFGDFSQVIEGRQGLLEVESSTEAAYVDSSSVLQSSFSNDQTVIRLIERHDFAVRLPQAIAKCVNVQTNNDY